MCGTKVVPFLVTREVPELDYVEDIEVLERHLEQELDRDPAADPSASEVRHAI